MTHEFCEQTSFVKKQVQITSQSIQTNIQTNIHFPPITQNHTFFFPFDQFFNGHIRLNSFFWLQGHKNLRISRIVRFILPFLFNLYDEYVCSLILIFSMIVYFNCQSGLQVFIVDNLLLSLISKTRVMVYKLVKQLSLIIMTNLHY